jgi:hypothetical protein
MTARLEDLKPDSMVQGLVGREAVRIVSVELERCLILAPGSLREQWQDELKEKFELNFELLTRDLIHATGLGNPFEQRPLLIARMDMLSRDEELQSRLEQAPEWDLVVCDESHRMSAHYFGSEVKRTKCYDMGKRVGNHARNLLVMTATPHNGKEEDFQLFMALLDEDRFAGHQRDAVHRSDPTGLMRRLVRKTCTPSLAPSCSPSARATRRSTSSPMPRRCSTSGSRSTCATR